MKILLDGEFFARWEGSLESLADFSDVDVSRLKRDPDCAIAEAERNYATEIEALDTKCVGALRAKLLGVAIDYDEALLIDAEMDCARLRSELKGVINALES